MSTSPLYSFFPLPSRLVQCLFPLYFRQYTICYMPSPSSSFRLCARLRFFVFQPPLKPRFRFLTGCLPELTRMYWLSCYVWYHTLDHLIGIAEPLFSHTSVYASRAHPAGTHPLYALHTKRGYSALQI
ncbi:hypothetical protein AG1IA_05764 [Rhizoctonia solani AG-1 IA]|uniref:Uncharacterized protein n=1 Tax=Thanatephorus cucumeris (strain AG1-IA) TaxID=983506 RepID=L8WTW4_THACA|nr:hypothetical protein AG1IA_05764 [Rhizoctonia solani AG-1 IA]